MKLDIINDFKFKKEDVNVNPVTGHVRIKVSYATVAHVMPIDKKYISD